MKATKARDRDRSNRPEPARSIAWETPAIFGAALLCALLAFGPALRGPFVFDDFHLPMADPHAGSMPPKFWIGGVRPMLMLTYWANYLSSGVDTFSYHATNLVIHAVNAVLVYLVSARVCALAGIAANRGPGLFAAGIFLLHPLQTESVDYMAGRSELVCALFVLSAWLVFLRNFERRITLAASAAILACAAAAVLSKESGICLIAILAATDFYWRSGSVAAQFGKRRLLYLPVLAGGTAATVIILRGLRSSTTAGFASGATPATYLLTECRAVAIYLKLFFCPTGQNLDWRLPVYRSLREGYAALFAAGLAALAAAVVLLYRRRAKLTSFGLFLFLATLSPTSSLVPIQDALSERRVYLPAVGLALVVAALAPRLQRFGAAAPIPMAAILAALAMASHARSGLWGSDILLWQDALKKNPGNARGRTWLAGAFMLRRDCRSAAREYKLVVEMEGLGPESGRNLATAYDCAGQTDEALAAWRALVKIHPSAEAWNRIGVLEALRNNVADSLSSFEEALRLDPYNANAYAWRGTARMALRDFNRAREDFSRAMALDPGNAIAASGLGKLPKEP